MFAPKRRLRDCSTATGHLAATRHSPIFAFSALGRVYRRTGGAAIDAAAKPSEPVLGKDVERIALPSGITLFVQEDHSQPTISLRFAWKGARLAHRLREEEELTYAVAMTLDHEGQPGVLGQLHIRYQTRPGQVLRSISWTTTAGF